MLKQLVTARNRAVKSKVFAEEYIPRTFLKTCSFANLQSLNTKRLGLVDGSSTNLLF